MFSAGLSSLRIQGDGMTRATYRFRDHTLTVDDRPEAEPLKHSMGCKACGESSEASEKPEDGSAWAVDHLKSNPGHLEYRAQITRPYRFEPGDWQ
ncbi:hypothetical protein SEA_EURATIS_54 [Streptomyces phage Euratis]|uniref:DUF7848 domain-containing protein n=1 Tax=Streptomyces phage Euratis TaxID=2510569 RepID=A0A411B119_9CAUD|nr:hypothetical protein SEA_EURATIS_54 [Streptomyces phage Euratis]